MEIIESKIIELLKVTKFALKKIRKHANDGSTETEIRDRSARKYSEMIRLSTLDQHRPFEISY